jgi:hypothetical protein
VGSFTGYFVPNSTVTKSEFQKAVNQNAYVDTLSYRFRLSSQPSSFWQLTIFIQLVHSLPLHCKVLPELHIHGKNASSEDTCLDR